MLKIVMEYTETAFDLIGGQIDALLTGDRETLSPEVFDNYLEQLHNRIMRGKTRLKESFTVLVYC